MPVGDDIVPRDERWSPKIERVHIGGYAQKYPALGAKCGLPGGQPALQGVRLGPKVSQFPFTGPLLALDFVHAPASLFSLSPLL